LEEESETMRNKVSGLILGTLAAVCALTAVPVNSHRGILPSVQAQVTDSEHRETCSVRSLRGGYGIIFQGFGTMAPVPALTGAFLPAAGVGVVKFDGSGSISLTDTVSSGGKVALLSTTGTYSVASDCTGTLTAQGAASWNFVIVHDGRQILAINTIQGRVAAVNLEKQ
jgi:hypothetical protein